MKILAVGGGSGGHVTPVVAVLKELRARHPRVQLRFWVDKGFAKQAASIMADFDDTIRVDTILSGKLRRYHHLSMVQHLLWPSLVFKNLGDMFKVAGGMMQSFFKLIVWRPDVIFMKGGFVCLPVGIAAHILRIPFVIHDSDAHPGLTNRILARWAKRIGTGAPLEYYSYPRSIAKYVGIPINQKFKPYTKTQQWDAKRELGINPERPLIVVTGGGLGARRLNESVISVLDKLKKIGTVILVSGAGPYEELRQRFPKDTKDFIIYSFVSTMDELLGAADVVITRAGATTMLELAALAKPTIIVPNAALTGGHQLKNAAVYEEAQASIVVQEQELADDPQSIVKAVNAYLKDARTTTAMTKRFATFARPDAAKDMATMILSARR